MSKCNKCGREDAPLEKWGRRYFCLDCVKTLKETRESAPKNNISDLTVMSDTYGTSYDPATGLTILYHDAYRLGVDRAISHEFIHYLLHKMVNLKCSYDFDNVRRIIKPYHNSNTTRDPNHINYWHQKIEEIDPFDENASMKMKEMIKAVLEEDKYYTHLSRS